MRKTDKKIDDRIRRVLKQVCEMALDNVDGFIWLTHSVNYDRFPESLSVVFVFARNEALNKARATQSDDYLSQLIQDKFLEIEISFKDISQHIIFDSEENCKLENNGKWHERLRKH